MKLLVDRISSPLGEIIVVSDGSALRAVDFDDYEDRLGTLLRRHYGDVELTSATDPGGASSAIRRYLDGDLDAIEALPTATNGTAFQKKVWSELNLIPVGTTRSYGDIAKSIGRPQASRAVGLANGSNPIAIVVPCHRVIGANGDLTGYGGGMERKQWLLAHEGALLL